MGQIMLERAKQKSEMASAALQNQPPKILVTTPDAKITPITGDDLIIETPQSEEIEVPISKSNKPE